MLKKKIRVLEWPANSPDLNPIENAWGLIKRSLVSHKIKNLSTLKDEINKIWEQFCSDYLLSLALSMPKRLELCIAAEGKHIPY